LRRTPTPKTRSATVSIVRLIRSRGFAMIGPMCSLGSTAPITRTFEITGRGIPFARSRKIFGSRICAPGLNFRFCRLAWIWSTLWPVRLLGNAHDAKF
jgi:hypothetical protein